MITEPLTEVESFQERLDKLAADQKIDASPMALMKKRAFEKFLETGLPTKSSETFRYMNLRPLYKEEWELVETSSNRPLEELKTHLKESILPECEGALIVFINGQFSKELSDKQAFPKKAMLLSLDEAAATFSSFLSNQWTRVLKEKSDPFALLSAAFHKKGAFLYLPPKTVFEKPLQIIHLIDSDKAATAFFPCLQIFAAESSEIKIVKTQKYLQGKALFISDCTLVACDENAKVKLFQTPNAQEAPERSKLWHFEAVQASLKKNALFRTVSISQGAASTRHDYRVSLDGENAEACLNGVWMLDSDNEAHVHILMEHKAPRCRSNQFFKGVLNDISKSSFEGKIYVERPAQKTEAYQLNNNLLLSDKCFANSKPNLEIFADDVKASHGATIGQLDREELFYLKTRGIAEKTAKTLLIYGFCQQILDLVEIPSLQKTLSLDAKGYLTKG